MNLGTRGALTFHLGDYSFAVRVEEACGVLDAERLAQLPGGPGPLAGLAAFRGEMIPVVDLAGYLGIDVVSSSKRYALVLGRGVDRFAIILHEIPRLIPGRDLKEVPASNADSELGDFLESMLEHRDDQFHLLNYWRIFESLASEVANGRAEATGAGRSGQGSAE